MLYSSIDTDRLNALHKVIDTSGKAADAGANGLSAIGSNIGSGLGKMMGNRAAKLEQEAKLKSELQDTLGMLEDQNRQQITAGQDNSQTLRLIDRVKQRLSQLGSVNLSDPTPTSPILKSGGLTAPASGPMDI